MKKNATTSNRRNFIKTTSLASAGILGVSATQAKDFFSIRPDLPKQLTVLFQGDSITDARRERSHYYPNDAQGMGAGYAFNVASHIMGKNPGTEWTCYNRGISGNKVYQLADRWEDDCLQLKPDVLSILIGVNDYWHMLNGQYDGTASIYDRDLRLLLDRTLTALPDVKIILGEPFAVKGGSAINDRWYPAFKDYQTAAAKIAKDYDLAWVPYQRIFDEALDKAPVEYWSPDGVHPSIAGGFLMASAWLESFKTLFK